MKYGPRNSAQRKILVIESKFWNVNRAKWQVMHRRRSEILLGWGAEFCILYLKTKENVDILAVFVLRFLFPQRNEIWNVYISTIHGDLGQFCRPSKAALSLSPWTYEFLNISIISGAIAFVPILLRKGSSSTQLPLFLLLSL